MKPGLVGSGTRSRVKPKRDSPSLPSITSCSKFLKRLALASDGFPPLLYKSMAALSFDAL